MIYLYLFKSPILKSYPISNDISFFGCLNFSVSVRKFFSKTQVQKIALNFILLLYRFRYQLPRLTRDSIQFYKVSFSCFKVKMPNGPPSCLLLLRNLGNSFTQPRTQGLISATRHAPGDKRLSFTLGSIFSECSRQTCESPQEDLEHAPQTILNFESPRNAYWAIHIVHNTTIKLILLIVCLIFYGFYFFNLSIMYLFFSTLLIILEESQPRYVHYLFLLLTRFSLLKNELYIYPAS